MTRTTAHAHRPELDDVEGCGCAGRCRLQGDCLTEALVDERFGVWARSERRALRLAS
ncbi:hypothetical protein TEK04_09310 [Klenkia sp. LSe6-5]|uniref:Transcription factor WhiB n=1 Tax=Klenkia sesuvii TaxID=3103137 RepID=A0ABU8DST6_9ACTN